MSSISVHGLMCRYCSDVQDNLLDAEERLRRDAIVRGVEDGYKKELVDERD